MHPVFDFSVITPVYNTKLFLPDTVKSLLRQSFGFSRVQLILVDDGSTDGSGAMCDAYHEAYPDNIFVIHKENGGVSSARNEGLKHVQGRYVNFLDSDDRLSLNALQKVYDFFEKYPETDVVSLPMYFFDGAKGGHILNYKFKGGTRLIDLEAEPMNPQLSATSAFIRAEALRNKTFDTRLTYAEDAKLLLSVLIEKRTLGVISDARHHYRRRSAGQPSIVQNAGKTVDWYFPCLMYFSKETWDHYEARCGSVPRFIQNTVAYDLSWRIRRQHIPSDLLDEQERETYRELVFSILRRIDDDILAGQVALKPYQKAFLLYKKHGTAATPLPSENGCLYRYGNGKPFDLEQEPLTLDFCVIEDGAVKIECATQMRYGFDTTLPQIVAVANDVRYTSRPIDRQQPRQSMDLPIAGRIGYVFRIPLPEGETPLRIRFFRDTKAGTVPIGKLYHTKFFPIPGSDRDACARIADRILTREESELVITKALDADPFEPEQMPLTLEFCTIKDGAVTLKCAAQLKGSFGEAPPQIVAVANGIPYESEPIDRQQPKRSTDLPIVSRIGCVFSIPLPEGETPLRIRFFRDTDIRPVPINELYYARFFPISGRRYKHAYAKVADRILTREGAGLVFTKDAGKRFRYEARFLAELLKKKRSEDHHAVIGRLACAVMKPFHRKPIWLISDRNETAGGNGEAFFRYLQSLHPKDIKSGFIYPNL